MIFTENQFESFSNPPFKYETKQIIRTKEAIQDSLNKNIPNAIIKESFDLSSFNYDIYLQGSYKNSTNITQSSDVDIVIELTSLYYHDTSSLNEVQKNKFEADRSISKYGFTEFKNDVQKALIKAFGNGLIRRGNKCILFLENGNYCNADILPCLTYKKFTIYESYSNSRAHEGIEFFTDTGDKIINFPHQHYVSLTSKNDSTSGMFKSTVRMFKNLKEQLIYNRIIDKGVAKSYFIENLLFNVDDLLFYGSFREIFLNVFNRIIVDFNNGAIYNYQCANGIQKLLSSETWNIDSLKLFLIGLVKIRDNNEF